MKFKTAHKMLATAVVATMAATGLAGCNRDGGSESAASGTVVLLRPAG